MNNIENHVINHACLPDRLVEFLKKEIVFEGNSGVRMQNQVIG